MTNNYQFFSAASRDELAATLAQQIGEQMANAIAQKGQVIIALSGGSTPKPLFIEMSKLDLDWSKVVITLVDERWVPISHSLSNAAFMHQYLLTHLPEQVRFVPLYSDSESIADGIPNVLYNFASACGEDIYHLPEFDIVVLGMGEDGHTASFFPDADNISALIDPEASAPLLTCTSPSTQVARVTWSVPRLLSAPQLYLHITGASKKAVFEQALKPGEIAELPIRSMLKQDQRSLQVYYAD